jgi:hypothetical protein
MFLVISLFGIASCIAVALNALVATKSVHSGEFFATVSAITEWPVLQVNGLMTT